MAKLVELKNFSDQRGNLCVLESFQIDFGIKRLFYIYQVDHSSRGGHRHKETYQAVICIQGSCKIYNNDGKGKKEVFELDSPSKCLLIGPADWHIMFDFMPDAILLVAASHNYNENDYIHERYEGDSFSFS